MIAGYALRGNLEANLSFIGTYLYFLLVFNKTERRAALFSYTTRLCQGLKPQHRK
jgi:hypothetical protein